MSKINCPHCYATNQLDYQRLGDNPSCGKCKKPLFAGTVLALSPSNIGNTLKNNSIPVVVDCWAPWCGPCKQFAPTFEQAAKQLEPRYRFAKLNTEAQQGIAQRWNIRSIPTLIVFKNNREVARQAGALTMKQLEQWLAQYA